MSSSRTRLLLPLALAALALSAAPVAAQPPDLRTMAGRPLPVGDLPAGSVSVRVANEMPANALPGLEVEATITAPGGETETRTATTGEDGRATFTEIAAGAVFQAALEVDGELLRSTRFAMPGAGGIRLMLIAGIGAEPASTEEEPVTFDSGGGSKRRFAIDAAGGDIRPAPELPAGALEVVVVDDGGDPLEGKAVNLAQLERGGNMRAFESTTGGDGRARFTDLDTGDEHVYVAVVEIGGFNLGSDGPINLGAEHGMRVTFAPLGTTGDDGRLTVGRASKIIVELREENLMLAQSLEFRNTGREIFDPRPAGLLIPLPTEFTGAQALAGGANVEIIKGSGVLLRDPVPPTGPRNRGTLARFGYLLPTHGDASLTVEQKMPQGFEAPLVIVPDAAELTVSGEGMKTLKKQEDNQGNTVSLYEFPDVPRGGTLRFTVSGLPVVSHTGRNIAAFIGLALLVWGIVGVRRPRDEALEKKQKMHADLVARREKLFSQLLDIEQKKRAGQGRPEALEGQRTEAVGKLETVYRDLADLEREL